MIVWSAIATETLESKEIIARWAGSDDHAASTRYAKDHAQHESLLARALLRALLANYTQTDVCLFRRDARGKLFACNSVGVQGPDISMAHTRGMVIGAVSTVGPIGVDIERHRPRAFTQIADWGFGPAERMRVGEEGMGAFYRIWTLREAIAKATGDGLVMAMDGKDRVAQNAAQSVWRQSDGAEDWLLGYFCPASGISAAAACRLNGDAASTITTMSWVDPERLDLNPQNVAGRRAGMGDWKC